MPFQSAFVSKYDALAKPLLLLVIARLTIKHGTCFDTNSMPLRIGQILFNRRGYDYLLEPRHLRHQRFPSTNIQFSKPVVEDNHRVARGKFVAQQGSNTQT